MGRKPILLILLLLLAFLCSVASAKTTRPDFKQPGFLVGTVFIYSDGDVEKLIDQRRNWVVIETMRKQRYKNDLNFVIPTLEKSTLTYSYQQRVIKGNPDRLFPLDKSRSVDFVLQRKRDNGKQRERSWSCAPATRQSIEVLKTVKPVYKVSCDHIGFSKNGKSGEKRESFDYYYDPSLSWVVKRVRYKKGKESARQLMYILPPDKATPRKITRLLKKIRR